MSELALNGVGKGYEAVIKSIKELPPCITVASSILALITTAYLLKKRRLSKPSTSSLRSSSSSSSSPSSEEVENSKNDVIEFPELPNRQFLIGHLRKFQKIGDFTLDYLLEECIKNRTFQFKLPLSPPILMTSDPLVIQRILATGFKEGIYQKSPQTIRQYRDFLGRGIFLSNGETWQQQRNAAAPLFHKVKLQSYVDLFRRNALHLISVFLKIADRHDDDYAANGIDFQDYFFRYTLDSFCEIGFGVNLNSIESTESAVKFQRAFDYVQTFTEHRGRTGELWRIKELLFADKRFKAELKYMNDFISNIIDQRKDEPIEALQQKEDLISHLLVQNAIGESSLTTSELRDWVMNFLIAGRDTTAVLLTWCCYLLAKPENADVTDRCRSEIADLLRLPIGDDDNNDVEEEEKKGEEGNKRITEHLSANINFEVQKNQKYMQKVLQEVLRLYPPVPVDGFSATRDDVITASDDRKYKVTKDMICLYSAWVVHRHPENFENPLIFNPDRFDTPVANFSFVPFHGGPRLCLGQEMAYIEAKVMMTCLLSLLKFELVDASSVVPKQAIILTCDRGLRMKISRR